MNASSDILRRLAAVDMPAEALRQVLAIFADAQQEGAARYARDDARRQKDRERKSILRDSEEIPQNVVGISAENPSPKETPRTPIETTPPLSTSLRSVSSTPADGGSVDLFGTPEKIKARKGGPSDNEVILDLVDLWNEFARSNSLPTADIISPQRVSCLRARCNDFKDLGFEDPLAGMRALLVRVRASPWLMGEEKGGWHCDLDFIIKLSKFTKIMEGSYESKKPDSQAYNGRRGGSVNGFGRHYG